MVANATESTDWECVLDAMQYMERHISNVSDGAPTRARGLLISLYTSLPLSRALSLFLSLFLSLARSLSPPPLTPASCPLVLFFPRCPVTGYA